MPIYINNQCVDAFTFAGGECQIRLVIGQVTDENILRADLFSSDDIMQLLLSVDAIRRINPDAKIHLQIPYFPYARQDRVCYRGEAFSACVMAGLINNLNCDSLTITDPHSAVTPKLLSHCHVVSQADVIAMSALSKFIIEQRLTLIAPDKGAVEKTRAVVARLSNSTTPVQMICATKTRDPNTGQVVVSTLDQSVALHNVIILDDICDGGRTFIELAKLLKQQGAGDIYLYVTHGIFSQGLEILKPYFKHVFCYHLVNNFIVSDSEFFTLLIKENSDEC